MNKRRVEILRAFCCQGAIRAGGLALTLMIALVAPTVGKATDATPILRKLASTPLGFEPNRGQTPADVDYVATAISANVSLQSGSATLLVRRPDRQGTAKLRMSFLGGNLSAKPIAEELIPHVTQSYLTGNDPSKWITEVPKFAKVRYRQIWPGIDVVFYGNGQQLEYDFVVAAGADPSAIRLNFSGIDSLALDGLGGLSLATAAGTISQKAPQIYQQINGKRREIRGRFLVDRGNIAQFEVGPYDGSYPLIIDPLLIYSDPRLTSSPATAAGFGIAVTNTGTAYVVGQTVAAPPDAQNCMNNVAPITGAVVFRVDSLGNTAQTVLRGCDGDSAAAAVAVDSSGNVFFTGFTKASNFNFTGGGFQPNSGGQSDGYLIGLSGTNGLPIYSSFLGGAGNDQGNAIAIDNRGKAYVAGSTCSSDFPGPLHRAGSNCTGFALKVDPSVAGAGALVYSTFIGGTGVDSANGIAVDLSGLAFVGGATTSTSATFHPFTGTGFDTTKTTGANDGFIVKLLTSGTAAGWLTFIPGGPASALAIDPYETAYVTGTTTGLTLTNSSNTGFQTSLQGGTDAFLQRYDTFQTGSALLYSTYIGGSGADTGNAISADANGYAYITGKTSSANFPSTSSALVPNTSAAPDGFVTRVNTSVSGAGSLAYSLVLGGDMADSGQAIAADGLVFLSGMTSSSNFGGGTGETGSGAFALKLKPSTIAPAKMGLFTIANSAPVFLLDTNNDHTFSQPPDAYFQWLPGQSEVPVVGDWSGSGDSKLGIFYNGFWFLDYNGNRLFDNTNLTGPLGDRFYYFGAAGCTPLVGDWNGDGREKIGVYCAGLFFLDLNGNGVFDAGDEEIGFGPKNGATPVVGDWNGDGRTKIGIFSNGFWFLDYNGNGIYDGPLTDREYFYGDASSLPVVGDWTGDGKTKIGIYGAGQFFIDINGDGVFNAGDKQVGWGPPGSLPIVGDWNGDGKTKIGVYSFSPNLTWTLDVSGNFTYSNPQDGPFVFGTPTSVPIAGHWR